MADRVASLVGVERVEVAFLQLSRPDLTEAVEECMGAGVTRIAVVPFFLFPGAHVLEDIPAAVGVLEAKFPGIVFSVAPILAGHPKLAEIAADRAMGIL
ncbi:MAG: CbiX/SirB N-terminal domain-containing protein [Deltaproteobacteria bacterium]|nr:CbiX/SirB N-terminal domain-containing protein [Deltaproteobacteria bacterium]